jgi:hypothetical protein
MVSFFAVLPTIRDAVWWIAEDHVSQAAGQNLLAADHTDHSENIRR